ncbi:MAG: hypothetical protein FWC60_05185, partial [Firmicutes bacterium]|nr:hypothetical protein [Bacillota bacterium]
KATKNPEMSEFLQNASGLNMLSTVLCAFYQTFRLLTELLSPKNNYKVSFLNKEKPKKLQAVFKSVGIQSISLIPKAPAISNPIPHIIPKRKKYFSTILLVIALVIFALHSVFTFQKPHLCSKCMTIL